MTDRAVLLRAPSRCLLRGLILSLVLSVTAVAQDNPARAQLEAFSAQLDSLHARFSQSVVNNDGVVQDRSAGQVWLRRPDRFRWEYGGDFPEIVVADGDRIWIYDEVLEQVTVKDQSHSTLNSPLTLLTDTVNLEDQFEVREAGEFEGLALLELRSRSAEAEFDRVLLGLENDLIVLMILEDAFGLRTELRFENVIRNADIDATRFRFEPPPGTDVIGDLPEGFSGP